MLKVGVTGGMGSGKTLVCTIIASMGYPVYNADLEAHRIVDSDSQVIYAIKNVFGESIYNNNLLDRKRIAEIVFSDQKLLENLNSIVHPAVAKHFDTWVMQNQSYSLVIKEAAILFESGAYKSVDKTIVVTAPFELRVSRVIERNGLSRETILSRINNQLSQDELKKRGDYIIENDGVQLIIPQVVRIINEILKYST